VTKGVANYLSTGALARTAGVGGETLRFYEEQGLITPVARTNAGYRQFTTDVVAVIGFIKQTQRAGFSIKEIGHLLRLRADGQDTCGSVSKIPRGSAASCWKGLDVADWATTEQGVRACHGSLTARNCCFPVSR
jgi:DNA-binding transcriptional MerR regulator